MYHTETIKLTLNGETRVVDVTVFDRWPDEFTFYRAEMMTSQGAKMHNGTITIKRNASGEYTAHDIIHAGYHGMRGNGLARRSTFRYIGFQKGGQQ